MCSSLREDTRLRNSCHFSSPTFPLQWSLMSSDEPMYEAMIALVSIRSYETPT